MYVYVCECEYVCVCVKGIMSTCSLLVQDQPPMYVCMYVYITYLLCIEQIKRLGKEGKRLRMVRYHFKMCIHTDKYTYIHV